MAAQRLTYLEPVSPDVARLAHIQGTVVLHVFIGPDGLV
jgi:outer membrane biosynthesis protein TonB